MNVFSLLAWSSGKDRFLSKSDRLSVVWFAVCGTIHTFFEGYYAYNNKTMSSDLSWFGQAWKVTLYTLNHLCFVSMYCSYQILVHVIYICYWGRSETE
jgi:cholestenol delta-isomerase